jgi:hypothetical protein
MNHPSATASIPNAPVAIVLCEMVPSSLPFPKPLDCSSILLKHERTGRSKQRSSRPPGTRNTCSKIWLAFMELRVGSLCESKRSFSSKETPGMRSSSFSERQVTEEVRVAPHLWP